MMAKIRIQTSDIPLFLPDLGDCFRYMKLFLALKPDLAKYPLYFAAGDCLTLHEFKKFDCIVWLVICLPVYNILYLIRADTETSFGIERETVIPVLCIFPRWHWVAW